MTPPPSFDAVKLIVLGPATYWPVKPNVWSRIFCRWPPPDHRTSKLTCEGSGSGGGGWRPIAIRALWKSVTATLSACRRACPLPGSTLIAEDAIGIVQNNPDGAIPGSKSWSCWVRSPTASGGNKSIHIKPNDLLWIRPSRPTYTPRMNRMSQSKL